MKEVEISEESKYILKHCFIGECKYQARRELQGKLLDDTAKKDLSLADQMSDDYADKNAICGDAFDRLYKFENVYSPLIREFICQNIPDERWTKKNEPVSEGSYHTTWNYYLGNEPVSWITLGSGESMGNDFCTDLAKEVAYNGGFEESKQEMKEAGIRYKSFGMSKADHIRGTLFGIQEYFDEIKGYLKDEGI